MVSGRGRVNVILCWGYSGVWEVLRWCQRVGLMQYYAGV